MFPSVLTARRSAPLWRGWTGCWSRGPCVRREAPTSGSALWGCDRGARASAELRGSPAGCPCVCPCAAGLSGVLSSQALAAMNASSGSTRPKGCQDSGCPRHSAGSGVSSVERSGVGLGAAHPPLPTARHLCVSGGMVIHPHTHLRRPARPAEGGSWILVKLTTLSIHQGRCSGAQPCSARPINGPTSVQVSPCQFLPCDSDQSGISVQTLGRLDNQSGRSKPALRELPQAEGHAALRGASSLRRQHCGLCQAPAVRTGVQAGHTRAVETETQGRSLGCLHTSCPCGEGPACPGLIEMPALVAHTPSGPYRAMSSSTRRRWPQVAAACNGVQHSLSRALTRAPASRSCCTISRKSSMQLCGAGSLSVRAHTMAPASPPTASGADLM